MTRTLKRCAACHADKPLDAFYFHKNRGRYFRCKECEKARVLTNKRLKSLAGYTTARLRRLRESLVDKLRLIDDEIESRTP